MLIFPDAVRRSGEQPLSLQGMQWYAIQRASPVMRVTPKTDAIMDRDVIPYILKRTADQDITPKLSLDYARALNPQQFAAVTAGDGPALVIAGAGSGKTRTLVHRVAYLIDSGVDPSHILLLTFTRSLSEEMLERVGPDWFS